MAITLNHWSVSPWLSTCGGFNLALCTPVLRPSKHHGLPCFATVLPGCMFFGKLLEAERLDISDTHCQLEKKELIVHL